MRIELIRLLFIIGIGRLLITDVLGQEDSPYTHLHKSSKTIVRYKYVYKNDSLFMQGSVLERKTSLPVFNINISIIADQIGTVPNQQGDFMMYLKKTEGVIHFDKTQFDKFDLQYNSKAIR